MSLVLKQSNNIVIFKSLNINIISIYYIYLYIYTYLLYRYIIIQTGNTSLVSKKKNTILLKLLLSNTWIFNLDTGY